MTRSAEAAYLGSIVGTLALDVGPRPWSDLAKLGRAADFIAAELAAPGHRVTEQEFSFGRGKYRNLVAEVPGTAGDPRVLVVGAHYDTVAGTPGADDNASGVAGLLALARRLAEEPPACPVRLVAFALEEPPVYRTGSMGSFHHARSLRAAGTPVQGMVCLEMIGFFSDRPDSQGYPLPFMKLRYPSRGDFVALVGNRRSAGLTARIAAGFRRATDLPLHTLNAPAVVVGIDFSDHWAYAKHGFEAVMLTDTAFFRNPHYHAAEDLPDSLDYDRMAKVVAGLHGALRAAPVP